MARDRKDGDKRIGPRSYARLVMRVLRGLLVGEKVSVLERWRRALMTQSMNMARSSIDNEHAVATLRQLVLTHPDAAKHALNSFEPRRDSYLNDRAYRLISAAITGSDVAAPAPDRVERFEQERNLGHLPLEEAFDQLAHIVPELDSMRRAVEVSRTQQLAPYFTQIGELLGRRPDRDRDAIHSAVAVGIAMEYLSIISGDTRRGDASTSYFTACEQPMVTYTKDKEHREEKN